MTGAGRQTFDAAPVLSATKPPAAAPIIAIQPASRANSATFAELKRTISFAALETFAR